MRTGHGSPLLLVCIARPELLDVRPGWGGGKLNATAVLLEPLSEDESSQLVDNLAATGLEAATRRRVIEAAEGNPLFVEEMLALALEDGRENGELEVPPTIQALLAARLDRLADDERSVLEHASVEGKVFHQGSVVELSPEMLRPGVATSLAALVRKELIRPERALFSGEHGFRFRHLLIRDAAYESIPKKAREELHERYANWLEQKAEGTSSNMRRSSDTTWSKRFATGQSWAVLTSRRRSSLVALPNISARLVGARLSAATRRPQ